MDKEKRNSGISKNPYYSTALLKISMITFGLVSSVFYTRYMGPQIKGHYSYILNFINIGVCLLTFGLYQAYPYFKRQGYQNLEQKFSNLFYLQFIVYTILSVLLFFVIKDNDSAYACLLLPITVLVSQFTTVMLIEHINYRNYAIIINSLLDALLAAALFLFFQKNLLLILAAYCIKNIILMFQFMIRLKSRPAPFKFDARFTVSVFTFGFLPMITSLLLTLNYSVDVILIKNMMPIEYVGIYTVGVSLAGYAWIIPDLFKDVMFNKTARGDSIESLKSAVRITNTLLIPIIIGVILFGKFAIWLLFGTLFLKAYSVTVILFVGVISMAWFKIIGTLYLAQGRKNFYFFTLLASVIVNVVLNLIFIPLYGIDGAALSSVFSYSVCGVTFLRNFIVKYRIPLKDILIISSGDINSVRRLFKRKEA